MEMTFLETEAGRVGYVFSIGLFVAIVSQMIFALPTYGVCRSRWIENAEEPRLYSCKLSANICGGANAGAGAATICA